MKRFALRTALPLSILALAACGTAFAQKAATSSDVNVVNTPTVQVGNVVYVVPLDAREPVYFQYQLSSVALGSTLVTGLYQVPAGKRLTITFVSADVRSPTGVYIQSMSVRAGSGPYSTRAQHILAISPATANSFNTNIASVSQPMALIVNAGEFVGFGYVRSSALSGTPAANVTVYITGYLETVQ